MAAQAFGLASLVVVGVIIANLTIHYTGTKVLTSSAVSAEKASLNALLGKTS